MKPPILTLPALFDRHVAGHAERCAVKDARRAYSYRELSARAHAAACTLQDQGVDTGDRVVIYADRTSDTVAAVLGVLKSGAAFVPVSLDTPRDRLRFILEDAEPRVLLADARGRARLKRQRAKVEAADLEALVSSNVEADRSAPAVAPDDLAYIIYTSGTSGRPKGVMIAHGSIARRYEDWNRVFGLDAPPMRFLQLAKLGFDVFTADLVKVFGSGGSLILCPDDVVIDPARLERLVVDEAIEFIDIVPAVLRPLLDHLESSGRDLAGLRIINCGADSWTKDEYLRALRVTKTARLFNGYGVTECTVENTLFEDDGPTLRSKTTLPIGRALAHDEILVVDEGLSPVETGQTGELCIGGPCVAVGYLNRPELNARAFFVRTGRDGAPTRFYRTGDCGRVDAAGIFEFLGRLDSQIKINGHRIELEEIERVLERLPAIAQAVVCFEARQQLLTAFVKAARDAALTHEDVAAHLENQLPAYMIPRRIVAVESFPVNQNGKIDRARLAADGAHAGAPLRNRPAAERRGSQSAAELTEHLRGRGIDLIAVVHEFVKPTSSFALVVNGSGADRGAADDAPIDLMVLLGDRSALKRPKGDIAGYAVAYASPQGSADTQVSVTVRGVAMRLTFVAGALFHASTSRELASAPDRC